MKLAQVMDGIIHEGPIPDLDITGISHDSRCIKPGYLFIALPGLHVNGTDFVAHAIQKGATAVVGPLLSPDTTPIAYIGLEDPAASYSRIASSIDFLKLNPRKSGTTPGVCGGGK